MVARAKSSCRHIGCSKLLDVSGYCDKHISERRKQLDAARGSAHERGYNYRWIKARATFLRRDPLCRRCKDAGVITAATVVDHVIPHKGDQDVFWDTSNWQPLCKACHDKKTAIEDGGFGRLPGGP